MNSRIFTILGARLFPAKTSMSTFRCAQQIGSSVPGTITITVRETSWFCQPGKSIRLLTSCAHPPRDTIACTCGCQFARSPAVWTTATIPGRKVSVVHRRAHQLEHRLPCRAGKAAEELPVVQEVRPQHLGDHEDPLRVGHLLEHVLRQQRRRRRRPLRRARRAQLPRLAREREQVLLSAFGTPDPGEAVLEQTAVEVAQNLLVDEAPPEPVPALEALLPLPPDLLEVRFEEAIQGCRAGIPRAVDGRTACCHSDSWGLLQRGGIVSSWLK